MTSATIVGAVGVLTIGLSALVKIVGFPDQMRKNYRRKSVEGVSRAFYLLSFISYGVWTLYGALQKDLVVVLAQGLGVLATGAVVYQIILYGGKSDGNE